MFEKLREGSGISPLFGFGLLILVPVLFILFTSQSNPPSKPQVVAPPASIQAKKESTPQFMARIRKAARETHGDWTKLPFEDQRLLNGYSGGHGRTMFEMLGKEEAANAASPSKK